MRPRCASFAAAGLSVALMIEPAAAAEARKSGDWLFNSNAVAQSGDTMLNACSASTESEAGTVLTLRLEPVPDEVFDAGLTFRNDGWNIAAAPSYVWLDIGNRGWVMPAGGGGTEVSVSWRDMPYLPLILEDLASSREAVLRAANGDAIARFSLSGSRDAIEAMKTCLEEQIVGTLAETVEDMSAPGDENPF